MTYCIKQSYLWKTVKAFSKAQINSWLVKCSCLFGVRVIGNRVLFLCILWNDISCCLIESTRTAFVMIPAWNTWHMSNREFNGQIVTELRAGFNETREAWWSIPRPATVENKDLGPRELVEWVVSGTWRTGGSWRRESEASHGQSIVHNQEPGLGPEKVDLSIQIRAELLGPVLSTPKMWSFYEHSLHPPDKCPDNRDLIFPQEKLSRDSGTWQLFLALIVPICTLTKYIYPSGPQFFH